MCGSWSWRWVWIFSIRGNREHGCIGASGDGVIVCDAFISDRDAEIAMGASAAVDGAVSSSESESGGAVGAL